MTYGKVLGFDNHRYLTRSSSLTEVHLRLGGDFGSSFLQIPHWRFVKSVVFKAYNAASYYRSFIVTSDTLAFAYLFLLPRPRSYVYEIVTAHAGRTTLHFVQGDDA